MHCPIHKLCDYDCDLCKEEMESNSGTRGFKRSLCRVKGCRRPERGEHGFCSLCLARQQAGQYLPLRFLNAKTKGKKYEYVLQAQVDLDMREAMWALVKKHNVSLTVFMRIALRRFLRGKYLHNIAKCYLSTPEDRLELRNMRNASHKDQQGGAPDKPA